MSTDPSIAFYTRVSTDLQATRDEGSLDTQESRLRAFLAARGEESASVRVFREEGASGKNLDRPAMTQLMAAVRAGKIRRVMVTRLDRLSRSLLDFYELNQLFEKKGVEFVSLNESFDTSSPVGRAMLKLVLVFAELEREQTAERTRAAMKARAARGLWNGGPRPLGYDPTGNGHLEVNPGEAELVRLIFNKYLELRSAPRLASWLNDQGHRQKTYVSRRKGKTGGRKFVADTVRRILTCRIYLGEIEHKTEVFDGKHEAIVDRDLFDRVQSALADNVKRRTGALARAKYDYLLTGLLRCTCGHGLTPSAGNGQGGRYHYYRCVGLNKKDRHKCGLKQVRAERIDDAVLGIVKDAARDPDLIAEAVEEANKLAREQVSPLQLRVDQLKRELSEAEQSARTLLEQALSAGVSTTGTLRTLLDEAESRQTALRRALSEAEGELAVRQTQQLDLEAVVEAIRGFDSAWEHLTIVEKRELLQLMIQEVVVRPEDLEVALYEGRRVTAWLTGGGPSSANVNVRNDEPRAVNPGFVTDSEWLALHDHRQNLGDDLLGGLYASGLRGANRAAVTQALREQQRADYGREKPPFL